MIGRVAVVFILASALLGGAALYYLQVYGFYRDVETAEVRLMPQGGDTPEPIALTAFEAIDADSSPIRYRACFSTPLRPDEAAATYTPLDRAVPRNAPGWFDCFDAAAIAAQLDAGTARAFLGTKNVHFGVDRIVVLTDDGRGYVWHELNDCGQKAYDGTIVGEECPPRE